MFTVTESALKQIALYFKDNEVKPVRVFLSNGCSGQQIAMALDQQNPNDSTFELDGIQFLVDKDFLAQAQPIEIDFAGQGFKITSSLELTQGCGGCGSSSQCCG